MPKISYSKSDFAYLAEGVMATIESKSNITDSELLNANKAATAHNKLRRSSSSTMVVGKAHNRIISYVVAFDGPQSMETVSGWMVGQVQKEGLIPSEMIDMIIVLGKGVLWQLASFPELKIPNAKPTNFWAFIDQSEKNLLTLFVHMLTWVASSSTPPNTLGYVSKVSFSNVQLT